MIVPGAPVPVVPPLCVVISPQLAALAEELSPCCHDWAKENDPAHARSSSADDPVHPF